MKTPITPLRMPLELKEKAKKQAESIGMTLSQYVFLCIEIDLANDFSSKINQS